MALARQARAKTRIAQKYEKPSFEDIPRIQREAELERLNAITRPAQLRLMRAQFQRQASGLTEPVALDKLREDYATQAATTRFGIGAGKIQYLGPEGAVQGGQRWSRPGEGRAAA